MKFFTVGVLLVCAACFVGCGDRSVAENLPSDPVALQSPMPEPITTVMPSLPTEDSAIRKIDFRNFTYTGRKDYPVRFTLKNGEKPFVMRERENGQTQQGYSLANVQYFDVTGDGEEEAVVVIGVQTGGSASPVLVFVYTLENGKPKLLWNFISGDRVEGGLKDIYREDKDLVVELFGNAKYRHGSWSASVPIEKFKGDCCPINYTKTKFRWNGKEFAVVATPQLFDLDSNRVQ